MPGGDPGDQRLFSGVGHQGDAVGGQIVAQGDLGRDRITSYNVCYTKLLRSAGTGNERNLVLRELAVARALYACGDYNGLAEKTFRTYVKDLRGVYALHANEVLRRGKGDK